MRLPIETEGYGIIFYDKGKACLFCCEKEKDYLEMLESIPEKAVIEAFTPDRPMTTRISMDVYYERGEL